VRQLYTNDEEVLFQAARPLLLNGIEDVVYRPDLADRAIFFSLPPIQQAQRCSEAEVWREFQIAQPGILGALLDAAAHGLRSLAGEGCRPQGLPRMADFARWISACETALWPAGTFDHAYAENVIEADPVASRVREMMVERKTWTGTAAELLSHGAQYSGDSLWTSIGWPKNPRSLAGRLRRAQPGLRSLGIDIAFSREGRAGTRIIAMSWSIERTVCTVSPSAA
jgi:hypothetical protein